MSNREKPLAIAKLVIEFTPPEGWEDVDYEKALPYLEVLRHSIQIEFRRVFDLTRAMRGIQIETRWDET